MACLDVGREYADDTRAWQTGSTVDDIQSKLQRLADRFTAYCKGNGPAINAAKTQLIINGRTDDNFAVIVDGAVIQPADSLKLLGICFDNNFTTRPHNLALMKATRTRASLVARLAHYLPRGQLLRQVAAGLVMVKVSQALQAVVAPRLKEGNAPANMASVQMAFNDVARSITGCKGHNHVWVEDLLAGARIPSVNSMVITAVGLEAWKAFHSNDGGNGSRNPLGAVVFNGAVGCVVKNERPRRSVVAGKIRVPLRGQTTLVKHAAMLWNACPPQRVARTLGAARKAVAAMVRDAPL
jgi:hypothetical protein